MLLLVYVMEVSRVLAIGGNVRAAQQLQGACLGVANNIAESCAAQSRRDFIGKLKIAHKELIELEAMAPLFSTRFGIPPSWRDTVFGIADEIGKMLSASIRTAYRRSKT